MLVKGLKERIEDIEVHYNKENKIGISSRILRQIYENERIEEI